MPTRFFAHSGKQPDRSDWQELREHLKGAAERAGKAAAKFGAGKWGEVAGMLHDVGKYSEAFQGRIDGKAGRVDHSTAGAQLAVNTFGPAGRILAYIIAGHHAGLANGTGEGQRRSTLEGRLGDRSIPCFEAWRQEIPLPKLSALPPSRFHPNAQVRNARDGFRAAFLVRMLFSCLVDADYLDTEAYYDRIDGRTRNRAWPPAAEFLPELNAQLDRHLAEKQLGAEPTAVNAVRAEVLAAARAAGTKAPGLFTLTVPTGGGKTLSSLAFALEHAIANKDKFHRVIFVIPFTSIIEQTAAVFRGALGEHADAIVEHHSAFNQEAFEEVLRKLGNQESGLEARDKLKLATENWDAPIVVTTAVQFFESLFAATPSKCRKLHNIARSVVILDEAQMLPVKFLKPCVAALDELVRNYGTTVVLCTATQPALTERRGEEWTLKGGFPECEVKHIIEKPEWLFEKLKRVQVCYEKNPVTDAELAERVKAHEQMLCIVGTRAHARELYERIKGELGAYHLSALMCAEHRSRRLDEIKQALKHQRPCRVIATTVVEAGVDVDFPVVFRAAAGLDAVAQAAGRCNREGRRRLEDSPVFVFEPQEETDEDGRRRPKAIKELRPFVDTGRDVLRRHLRDPLSPLAIEEYFRGVYWRHGSGQQDLLDEKGVIYRLNERSRDLWFPFEDVEHDFRMIESGMLPVIIPYDDLAEGLIARLAAFEQGEAEHGQRAGDIARKLQRYVVNVPRPSLAALKSAGSIQPIAPHRFEEQFVALANRDLYRDDIGLDWTDPTFRSAERNVF